MEKLRQHINRSRRVSKEKGLGYASKTALKRGFTLSSQKLLKAGARVQSRLRGLAGTGHFSLAGQQYPYLIHHHNTTWANERGVEIPIALAELQKHDAKKVLELGNVLSNYVAHDHLVVDKYEKAPGVINQDIIAYQPDRKFDLIISISTIEHIGWEEEVRQPDKIPSVLAHLKSLLSPKGKIVATFPVGYNTDLDRHLGRGPLFDTQLYLKRVDAKNRWQEVGWDEVKHSQYGKPFPKTNSLVIGISYANSGRKR